MEKSKPIRIAAALACRNTGSRLYGKPLQRLGNKTILQHIIDQLRELDRNVTYQAVAPYKLEIVLGISEGIDNLIFQEVARENGVLFIVGDEHDVQFRLLQCAHRAKADVILRITTESPFTAWEYLPQALAMIRREDADLVTVRGLPDGCTFELIRRLALERAHDEGDATTRTELCAEYLFKHQDKFHIKVCDAKDAHQRPHYRLTVDYPDDLVVCKNVFDALSVNGRFPEFAQVIRYLDDHPQLMKQLEWITGDEGRPSVDRFELKSA